jgi:hypothetical protein
MKALVCQKNGCAHRAIEAIFNAILVGVRLICVAIVVLRCEWFCGRSSSRRGSRFDGDILNAGTRLLLLPLGVRRESRCSTGTVPGDVDTLASFFFFSRRRIEWLRCNCCSPY